jgi:hypothetical protein
VKRAARDKVAKQQAQLWLMLEHRSVTRLQAAYRGRKGRERMHEQELLRPGVREAVREQERAAIVERHAEQARREQETAGKRQRKAAEAIAREEMLALRAQESFLTRNERLKREAAGRAALPSQPLLIPQPFAATAAEVATAQAEQAATVSAAPARTSSAARPRKVSKTTARRPAATRR